MPRFRCAQWLYLVALLPVFAGTYSLAHWLRFDGNLAPDRLLYLQATVGWVMLVKLVVFGWFRVHHGWGRSATFHDMVVLAEASTASSVLIAVVDYLLFNRSSIPRSVFLMDWGATTMILGGLRTVTRLVQERYQPLLFAKEGVRAFIVGANEAGASLLRGVTRSRHLRYNVVGFLDDVGGRAGTRIDGVPVVGDVQRIAELAAAHEVREVLVSAGELPGRRLRQLVEECRAHDVRIKVLPSLEQLVNDEVTLRAREVSIEDLLRREPVQLDVVGINQSLAGRTLLVTGSAGSIGSEICRQLLQFAPGRLLLVDRSENGQFFVERELRELAPAQDLEVIIADIADRERMQAIFANHRPEVIFHAAAYKHVPLMEANPGEAVKNNVLATRTLADLAEEHGCRSFVMISTDKAVRPTSVMGACKRVAELYVQAIAGRSRCRFVTVRFGNVLDSAGSVVPIFRQQIAQGGPVTVTDKRMRRFFMTIPEAAQLVIQGGVMGQGGEIFVLDMGEPVGIDDLARDMIRLSGLRVGEDIEIEYVGLRPGEKLYEELHLDGEQHLATRHPKIVVAAHEPHSAESVAAILDRLHAALRRGSQAIVAELERAIPEYQREDHLPKAPLRVVHPPHELPAPHAAEVRERQWDDAA